MAPLPPGLVFLVVDDVVKVVGDVDPSLTSLGEAEESAISGNYEEKEKREDGDEVWHGFGERTVRRKGRGGCKWCGCKYSVDNILMNLYIYLFKSCPFWYFWNPTAIIFLTLYHTLLHCF